MKSNAKSNSIFQLLGVVLFIQALMPLISGLIFDLFESKDNISVTMTNIANNVSMIYITIFLWIMTAVVIIILGTVMYRMVERTNKALALIALNMYVLEAVLVSLGQVFVFGLVKSSQLYLSNGDLDLLDLGEVLLSCRHFAGEIAMIPFGIGAIFFYYLLLKVKVLPKWLALWGLLSVLLIMVGIPLMTFGFTFSFTLFIPYVPFEFFTGIYILIRYRKKSFSFYKIL